MINILIGYLLGSITTLFLIIMIIGGNKYI